MADAAAAVMQDYRRREFTAALNDGKAVSHAVYERGEGPPLVLIQELPGIGTETLRLAERLAAAGFHVVLPHLFGPLGRTSMVGNLLRVFCMRREFALFQKRQASPVTVWLAALCRDVRERADVRGVGVIGMCLTGNFGISLLADDAVLAGVASQPSLPLNDQRALHMSADEVARVRSTLDREGAMLALRFAGDRLCRAEKFAAIDEAFNDDGATRVRLCTLPGKGHSVLTLDFVDEAGHPTRQALADVIAYFDRVLREG